jgi:alkanesulfonate monooxygenase SsuD/methylene tetrahydromethanopterin reductase-like flavin-dependent oxidoreductase (luciferase family)
MITLAAEIADGWFPVNYAPGIFHHVEPLLAEGFRRAGGSKGPDQFDIWAHVDVIVDQDVRAAMRPFKEYVATYASLQRQQIEWRGYGDLSDVLIELVDAGRIDEAIDAVPDEYVDDGWLVGPLDRVTKRVEPWLTSGASGLIVRYGAQIGPASGPENLEVFRAIAQAVGAPGSG